MPSDHARIRRDIWADTDWRRLSAGEQWLYLHLLSSPTLSLCGVADWRPARIAKMAAGTSADDVVTFSAGLIDKEFVLPDFEAEEIAIRSWVKHDGLMRSPNVAKALRSAQSTGQWARMSSASSSSSVVTRNRASAASRSAWPSLALAISASLYRRTGRAPASAAAGGSAT